MLLFVVAANIGVILYHGDPRQPQAVTMATANAASLSDQKSTEAVSGEGTKEDHHAVEDVRSSQLSPSAENAVNGEVPGSSADYSPYDPLLGLGDSGMGERVETVTLKWGQTAQAAVSSLGVTGSDIDPALRSLREYIDFRRLRPGNTIKARFEQSGRLLTMDIEQGLLQHARTQRVAEQWVAEKIEAPVSTVVQR
ncbi:MAG: hypothetical protein R3C68_16875 [Myxococcota bacterium]